MVSRINKVFYFLYTKRDNCCLNLYENAADSRVDCRTNSNVPSSFYKPAIDDLKSARRTKDGGTFHRRKFPRVFSRLSGSGEGNARII